MAFDNSFYESGRGVTYTTDWEDNEYKWSDPETGTEYWKGTSDSLNKFDYKNNNAWSTGAGFVGGPYRRINYSAQVNYNRKFGEHNVGAMGNVSREQ